MGPARQFLTSIARLDDADYNTAGVRRWASFNGKDRLRNVTDPLAPSFLFN